MFAGKTRKNNIELNQTTIPTGEQSKPLHFVYLCSLM